jgi:CheY-like chemotaxis protein
MLFCLAVRFIPQIDLVPLAYLFLSFIVLLYFTQSKVKLQFLKGKYDPWHRSILVIDDDEMIFKILRPVLFSHGYSVLTASSGEDGLQITKMQKPDLVILDVILPGIKGREVCKKIKEDPETHNIPVVFLTAKNSEEDIRAENEVGSSGHLTKPVDAKKLIEVIQHALNPKKTSKA